MIINQTVFNCELSDVIAELQRELQANGIFMLQRTKETETHIMVQCPFHKNGQEKRPSAGIRKSDGKFHCFTCGEIHELPEVISYCFGKNDVLGKFGYQWLLKNFLSLRMEERKDVKIDVERNNISDKSFDKACMVGSSDNDTDDNKFVSEEELDKYRYYHSYWTERKITNETIIEIFDLGYDKETDCITFPVRDIDGNCVFVARRSVKTKYFNYPRGVEKPVYGLYELNEVAQNQNSHINITDKGHVRGLYSIGEVIICESMIDALTCWQYGKYAVALNGTGTKYQFKQLREIPCRKFILATDNDYAGQMAREKIRKNLSTKIITEYILPSDKKDINELSYTEFQMLQEIF